MHDSNVDSTPFDFFTSMLHLQRYYYFFRADLESFEGFEEDGYTFFKDVPERVEPSPVKMKPTSAKFKKAAWSQAVKVAFSVM